MLLKEINLSKLEDEPTDIREAIAFYTAYAIFPIHFSADERTRHYKTLESAGYLERIS